jgi:hypothetical protein
MGKNDCSLGDGPQGVSGSLFLKSSNVRVFEKRPNGRGLLENGIIDWRTVALYL